MATLSAAAYSVVMPMDQDLTLRQFRNHSRDWRENYYVYPVISRRSRGLSIGVNLNPDTACNFDCVYCQVDRTVPPRVREVDLVRLRAELAGLVELATTGSLFDDPSFHDVPQGFRRINDLAFSGDGEPTTCRHFAECVRIAADVRREASLSEVKIVLITDACYLTRPEVVAGLAIMDENNGEVWAKLDAGTEAYYRRVNRPNYPLTHVMQNIIAASRVRPVVIQSLFMCLDGDPPGAAELHAFVDRLNEIKSAGGRIAQVQVYTVSRRPAESFVTPLRNEEVDAIVGLVRARANLLAEGYYAGSQS